MRKKIVALGLMLAVFLTVSAIPPTKTQFVISSGDYDEFGNGIEGSYVFENSTGSWEYIDAPFHILYSDGYSFEWEGGVFIKLRVFAFFNSTQAGAASTTEGKNYLKHNISVIDRSDTVVFSQQNFTYYSVSTSLDPIWYYGYDVILDFLPAEGNTYTATIIFEVYY